MSGDLRRGCRVRVSDIGPAGGRHDSPSAGAGNCGGHHRRHPAAGDRNGTQRCRRPDLDPGRRSSLLRAKRRPHRAPVGRRYGAPLPRWPPSSAGHDLRWSGAPDLAPVGGGLHERARRVAARQGSRPRRAFRRAAIQQAERRHRRSEGRRVFLRPRLESRAGGAASQDAGSTASGCVLRSHPARNQSVWPKALPAPTAST